MNAPTKKFKSGQEILGGGTICEPCGGWPKVWKEKARPACPQITLFWSSWPLPASI